MDAKRVRMVGENDRGKAAKTGTPSRRGAPRDPVLLAATMTMADGVDRHEVRVRNLSERGLMAEFAAIVPAGTRVVFELPDIGQVPGYVAWCTGGRLGIAFDLPIDPGTLSRSSAR